MGVTGLWETIKFSGRPVSVSSLRNKTLAVDVSLWMHQAVNGIHQRQSVSTADAHLIVLFNRICSLLEHRIKPIFVFDGIPPDLKQRVLQSRRRTQEPRSNGQSASQEFAPNSKSSQTSVKFGRGATIGPKSIFAVVQEESDSDFYQRPTEQADQVHADQKEEIEDDPRVERSKTPLANSTLRGRDVFPKLSMDYRTESNKDATELLPSTQEFQIDSVFRKRGDFVFEGSFSAPSSPNNLEICLQPPSSFKSENSSGKTPIRKNKDEEEEFGIYSSVESRGTVPLTSAWSEEEIQLISCLPTSTKTKKANLPKKKTNLQKQKYEDFLEITAVRQRKNVDSGAEKAEFSRGFRLQSIPSTSTFPTKAAKLFPIFISSREAPHKPKSRILAVSPEKRKKKSPKKFKIIGFVDLTADSETGENFRPNSLFLEDLESTDRNSSHPKGSEEKEVEKSFTEEEMKEEFWRLLYSPDRETLSSQLHQPDLPLNSWTSEVPTSQQDLFSASQILSQGSTRQKNGPSVPLPENLKEKYQTLMNLFGMPFLESPGEAEAQCAYLESSGVTQGTISDDGDVLLFGGRRVYRHFFKKKEPVEFDLTTIFQQLQLDREKLIAFALLTGSDYSDGIKGVGPVRALEILAEFSDRGVESLLNFSDWWRTEKGLLHEEDSSPPRRKLSKLRKSLLKHTIPDGFPSDDVVHAYFNPQIDTRARKFLWGKPNFQILRRFAEEKFSWNEEKIEKIFQPRMKKLGRQLRIDQFFQLDAKARPPPQLSQRMGKAVKKMKDPSDMGDSW